MQVTTTEVLGLTPQGTHVKGISRREAEKAGSEREEENQESYLELRVSESFIMGSKHACPWLFVILMSLRR